MNDGAVECLSIPPPSSLAVESEKKDERVNRQVIGLPL
jgi:hypothetical protein